MTSTSRLSAAHLRPRAHHFALEARQLFDGAAFVEAAAASEAAAPPAPAPDAHAAQAALPDAHASAPAAETPHDGSASSAEGAAAHAAPAATEGAGTTVYVVDQSVNHWQDLVAQLPQGSDVVLIDSSRSGVAQLAQALAGRSNIASLHILSHGAEGSISLGSDTVTTAALAAGASQWQAIGAALTDQGDILLYGCDVSAASDAFAQAMAAATGADVATSADATGRAAQGGNWTLERSTGSIETGALALAYDGVLAAPTVNTAATSLVVAEPSPLNAVGADQVQLSGWTVGDDGPGNVTVTVFVDGDGNSLPDTLVGSLTVGSGGTGQASLSFTGTPANAQAWLNSLVFHAADTELGNTAASATLHVSVTDSETPALTATRTLAVTVTPSNDPTTVADATQSVAEIGNTTITAVTLNAIDPERAAGTQTPAQIVYAVTALPQYGYLMRDGTRLGVGSIFTQQDVIDGKVVYVHTATGATQNTADGFGVRINDGATPLASSDTATITLNITPENQAPVVSGSGSVYEGQPANAVDGSNNPLSIVGNLITASGGGDDADSALTLRISALPTDGTLYFTGTAVINGVSTVLTNHAITSADITTGSGFSFAYGARGGLSYANAGQRDNSGATPSYPYTDGFDVVVTDGGGGAGIGAALSTTATIALEIRPVDDDPVWDETSTREATVLDTGPTPYSVIFTTAMLNVTDVDSVDTQLTFVITSQAGLNQGRVLRDGTVLPNGATFTLQDVIDGRIRYTQMLGASPGDTDTFNFQVVDNAVAPRWNADGTSVTRIGGVYTDGGTPGVLADDALRSFTFTLNLAPTDPGGGGILPDPPITTAHADSSYAGTDNTGASRGQLDEGGTIVLSGTGSDFSTDPGLSYTVTGVPPTQVVYTVTGLTSGPAGAEWNGQLQRFDGTSWITLHVYDTFTQADLNAGRVRYQHDGASEDFQASVSLSASAGMLVDDGMGGLTTDAWNTTFGFFVTPTNDAPVVTGSSSTVIPEGATAAITTGQLSIVDADDATSEAALEAGSTLTYTGGDGTTNNYAVNHDAANPLQFRITTLPTGGTLQYYDGSVWLNVAMGQLLDASLITASAGTTGLRFVSDGGEVRNTGFDVEAVDRWGAVSNTATVSIQITNINDAPRIATDPTQADPGGNTGIGEPAGTAVNEPLTLIEGSYAQLTTALLSAYDPDSTTTQVQFRITGAPASGRIAYSPDGGVTFLTLGVGSSFTQADLAAGRIYYLHGGSESNGATYPTVPQGDKFTFTLSDGDKEQAGNEFWIYVTPTNDAPTVSGPSGPVLLDNASGPNPVTGFSVADADLATVSGGETDYVQVVVRLLNADGSAFGATDYSTTHPVNLTVTTSGAATIDADKNGAQDYLVIRGTRADVNATLTTLAVEFGNDENRAFQVQVVADDRLRDGGGTLTAGANGGPVNQGTTPGVPATEPNYYTVAGSAVTTGLAGNLAARSVTVHASTDNDPAVLTGPASLTAYEDQTLFIGGGFAISDLESTGIGLPVSVSFSVPAGQGTLSIGALAGVTVSGSGTGTLTLTGRADLIESLVTNSTTGLKYTTPANGNGDFNGADPGSVTLTVSLSDSGARVGGDTGAGSVNTSPSDLHIPITLLPVNDAPTVSSGSPATVPLVGLTAVPGLSVGDVDLVGDGGLTAGETDFVQVTVRVTSSAGVPLAGSAYMDGASPAITLQSSSAGSATVDTTYNGQGSALVVRGTLAQVNAYLAGLQVKIEGPLANADATYRVEVVADDRLRNADGTLADTDTVTVGDQFSANGGGNPAVGGGVQAPAATVIDPYAAVPGGLAANVASNYRTVFPTDLNDPGQVTGNNFTVNEGSATVVLDASNANLTLLDPDAGTASNMTATVSVPAGFAITAVGGTGSAVISGDGLSVVITGTQAQINSSLKAITVQLPDEAGAPLRTDWNGAFDVTVVYNDRGNTGVRPVTLVGDGNDPTTGTGDYEYADTTSGSTDNALVTTRVVRITVAEVNDAPVATSTTAIGVPATRADRPDQSGSEVGALFSPRFSDPLDAITGGSSSNSFHGIAVTGSAPDASGQWQYSTDGGASWTSVGPRTAANALVLAAGDRLRFVPAADFAGTPPALTTVLVEDGHGAAPAGGSTVDLSGGTGGITRYSAASIQVTTSVPAIGLVVNDGNGGDAGDATVYEHGIPDGDGSKTTTGTFVVTAPDGVASVSVAGTAVPLADLVAIHNGTLTGAPIATTYGTLTLTDYDAATGTVSWRYTLVTAPTAGSAGTTDAIAVRVTDTDGDTADGTVNVHVIDDAPTARDDSAGIQLGGPSNTVGGNVIGAGGSGDVADRVGADGPATVTALSRVGGGAGAVGTPLAAVYGTLTLNADGSYSYAVNADHPAVKNLYAGQTLVEVFSYTITDADGNTSSARLTITILGPDTRVPDPVFHGLDQRDPPVIYQPFEPALFVQLAVQDSAALSQTLSGQMVDGDGLADGDEIQGDILGILQDMTNAQHVSRDGVAFSRQLLGESQARARSLGNGLVLAAQTLFDDFSAFGPRPVGTDADGDGSADNAPPAAAPAANPSADAGAAAAVTAAAARGAPAFSEQLRAVGEARAFAAGLPEGGRPSTEGRPTVKVARARPAAHA